MKSNRSDGNSKKRWGRRLGSTIGWAVLVNISYYVCLLKGMDLSWWVEYTRFMTYALGFLVGGLTITDTVLAVREKR